MFLVKISIDVKFNSESNCNGTGSVGFCMRGLYMVPTMGTKKIGPKIVSLRILNKCRYDYVSTSHVDGSPWKC
jgi:hypothetical protein